MSDRGELYVHYAAEHEGATGYWRPAEPADLLAAVRGAIEDGTIEGEVVSWMQDDWGLPVVGYFKNREPFESDDQMFLVIPVSDGGSET
jgi:hypothetical protein